MEGGTMTKKRTGPDDVGASLDELVNLTAGALGPAGSATPSGATTAGPVVEVRLDLADDGGPPFAPDDVYDAGEWGEADEAASGRFHDEIERRDAEERANRERRERARASSGRKPDQADEATKAGPAGVMLGAALPGAVELLEARARREVLPVPMYLFPWGAVSHVERQRWTDAEEMLGGGLWPGLWMLVGATGTGKTQLALALSLGAALHGCPVAYVGLELDNVGIVARLLGLLSRRPWSDLYLGKPAHTGGPLIEVEAVRTAAGRLEDLPILLVEGGPMGWAPDRLADVGRELAALAAARGIDTKKRPPLVVLDFLQLVGDPDGDTRGLPVRERIQRASYQARELARSLGVVVIAVSSTSRENAKNLRIEDGALPWPSELVGTGKESGEIEYSADGVLVMCGHASGIGNDGGDGGPDLVSLAVAKLRAGKVGWLHLEFNGHAHRPASDGRIAALEAAREAAETSPGALLVAGKMDEAKARINKCDDPDVLLEAMRAEDRGKDRKGVKDAIRARLADLTGAADDDGAKGGSGTTAGTSKAGKKGARDANFGG
jgi:hypothetical protein